MIEKGKTVSIDYVLTVDGKEIDSSKGKEPLTYVQGEGNIISGLEKELEGLTAGTTKEVVVAPEDGYGLIKPEAFREMPKANLPSNIQPQAGMVLTAKTPEGQTIPIVIAEVRDTTIVVDFNHPLAGKKLHFDVTIVDIK